MRAVHLLAIVLSLGAVMTRDLPGQVLEHVANQQAGATDWFGERALKVRGGARVEIESRVDGHVALIQMQPDGVLQVVRVATFTAGKQAFDVVRPFAASGGTVRVPFVVTGAEATDLLSGRPRNPPPPPPRTGRDGILAILTDVPLDSADLATRIALLPALPADSIASHVGQLLVGRRTAMWATYLQRR